MCACTRCPVPLPLPLIDKSTSCKRAFYGLWIQVNEATSWLDGSVIYGNSISWSENLRSYSDGKLREESENSGFPSRNRHELPLYNPIVASNPPLKQRNPEEIFST